MRADRARALIAAVARYVERQICAHHWHPAVTGHARARCCWCDAGTRGRRPRDERRDCRRAAVR